MERYANYVVDNPKKIVAFALILIVLCGFGFKFFHIETDYEVFFDGANARLAAHKELENEYGRKDGIRIGIEPADGNVFKPENLQLIADLTEAFWQIPYSNRIESLTNFQYARDVEGELVTSDLFEDPLSLTAQELEERRRFALTEPALINISVNPTGTISGLIAYVTLPEGNPKASREIVDAAETILAEFNQRAPDLKFYVTGSVPTNLAFFQASTKGMGLLVLMFLVVGLSLMALILRSAVAIIGTFAVIVGSVTIGLGLASALQLPFTAFSSNAIIIVIAVVIANTVHVISLVRKGLNDGMTSKEAIVHSLLRNHQPIFLTTLTTAIGLLCLNFSDTPPSRFLGITSAIGVTGALVLTYSLLPALLAVMPLTAHKESGHRSGRFWRLLSDFVLQNKLLVSGVLLALIATFISQISRNEVNDSVLTYFDESVKFRSDTDYLIENLFFYSSLDMSIPSGQENGINSPEYLKNLGEFIDWLESKPQVYSTLTFAHTMKSLNRSMHDGDQSAWVLPDNQALASQYLLLYEMSLPYGFDMANIVNNDKSSSKLIVGFRDISSQELIAFEAEVYQWMDDNFPEYMRTTAGGPPIMFASIWSDAARSNLKGMLIAIVVISIIIGFAMRSVSLGALSLLPNLLPGLMAFGLWGLISGRIDMGASVVAIITFGIVVDDTIHFISKFKYGIHQLKYTAERAVHYAMSTVGEAITITTLVLLCGFGILAQSSFTLTSNMGKLTCILLFFAWLLDLLLLPILLWFLYRDKTENSGGSVAAHPKPVI